VLALDPEAVVLVHYSGHTFLVAKKHATSRRRRGGGTIKIKTVEMQTASRKPVKILQDALKMVQRRFCIAPGVDRRIVVVGYNALARTTSTRTDDMVPTHMFTLMGKGRNSADVRQTIMRPGGKTTEVRHANGHGNVKVVTPEDDWELVTAMYGFQMLIAEGLQEDPSWDWEAASFPISAHGVVSSNRKHARPAVKLNPKWKTDATRRELTQLRSERLMAADEREARHEQKELELRQQQELRDDAAEMNVEDGEAEEAEARADADFVYDGPDNEDPNASSVVGEDLPSDMGRTNRRRRVFRGESRGTARTGDGKRRSHVLRGPQDGASDGDGDHVGRREPVCSDQDASRWTDQPCRQALGHHRDGKGKM